MHREWRSNAWLLIFAAVGILLRIMSDVLTPSIARPSLRMSEDEFVVWAGDATSAEWVYGEVVLKMPVEENHDEIQRLIASVIEQIARRRRLGKVRGPEFTTRLTLGGRTVRRDPDVMFVGNDKLPNMHPTKLEGPVDLVVEIVSPDSEFGDFNEKYLEYEEAGVGEYWIVNPLSKQVHLFVRDAKTNQPKTNSFARREPDADGRFRSQVIDGLWFHPDDLFAAERTDVVTLLKRIDPALVA